MVSLFLWIRELGTCGVEADARVCVRDAVWLVDVQLSCVLVGGIW